MKKRSVEDNLVKQVVKELRESILTQKGIVQVLFQKKHASYLNTVLKGQRNPSEKKLDQLKIVREEYQEFVRKCRSRIETVEQFYKKINSQDVSLDNTGKLELNL